MTYKEMNTQEFYAALGDDATKWAAAFRELVIDGGVTVDEELMIGWFANAIETAHDKRTGSGPVVLPDGSGVFTATI